jgi:endo-1,4-beta-xylanase
MKKTLLIATVCLGLLAIIGCASSSAAAAPQATTVPAPKGLIADALPGTPAAIDGTMDPVFAKAAVIETTQKSQGDNAATAKVRVVWDAKFIYVYAEVKDPKLSDTSANPWEQDSLEVFIDESNTKTEKYTAGDAQYRVNFKNVVSGGSGADTTKVKSGAKIVDGGYNITVAVPFLKTTPKAGSYIGFDLQVNDDDGGGARSGQRNWSDSTNNGWQSAAVFGNLHLLAK